MIWRDIISRSGRSLKSAKARTLLTASAIAVGTFALTLTLAASNGATAFVNKVISENFDPAELIVTKDKGIFGRSNTTKPREYDPSFGTVANGSGASIQIKRVTDDDIAVIKSTKGVATVREGITVNTRYMTRPGQKKYVATIDTFSPAQKVELQAGKVGTGGVVGDNAVLLPEAYVSPLGFSSAEEAIGKEVTISITKPLVGATTDVASLGAAASTPDGLARLSEQASEQRTLKIAGVTKKSSTGQQPGTELYLYADAATTRSLNDIATLGTPNYRKYTYVFARVEGGKDEAKLKVTQDLLKDKGFEVQSVKETQQFLTSIISILQGIVAAFALIAIIASVFGIVNTMYISVLQRTREIGLMKALGMRKRDIGRLFRFEAAWIGFLGGLIGSMLAVGLGVALNPWITTKLDLGKGTSLLVFKPMQVGMLIVILMLISILAGWLPSRKAAKLDPIEALRTE